MATIIRRRKLGVSSAKGIAEKSQTGIRWIRNDKPLPADDLYIRWGCTSNVPTKNVVNTSRAIHEVADKRGFRLKLDEHDLCPPTWGSINDLKGVIDKPLIVRRSTHHQGRFMDKCTTEAELRAACKKYGEGNYYISEFFDKVEEFRVFVAQGRAVCVAKKTPADPKALAWNVAQGGRFDNVRWGDWPLKAVRVSIEAFNLSSLDFGGVDVMVDAQGNCAILEINSAPSLTSDYRQQCFAKALDHIVLHGKERIPLVEERGGWRKFIHPAISEDAMLVNKKKAV